MFPSNRGRGGSFRGRSAPPQSSSSSTMYRSPNQPFSPSHGYNLRSSPNNNTFRSANTWNNSARPPQPQMSSSNSGGGFGSSSSLSSQPQNRNLFNAAAATFGRPTTTTTHSEVIKMAFNHQNTMPVSTNNNFYNEKKAAGIGRGYLNTNGNSGFICKLVAVMF